MSSLFSGKHILVLRGGPSDEYDLSMTTGSEVLGILQSLSNTVLDIPVSRASEWLRFGKVMNPQDLLESADYVFVALHGAYGEDGQVQRILNRHAARYNGSGPMASGIAFNKMLTKEYSKSTGVKMPRHMRVSRDVGNGVGRIASTIDTLFGPNFIVKPNMSGSSLGVEYASSISELIQAIEAVLEIYPEVLVEEYIDGIDVTCAYLADFRDVADYTFPPLQLVRGSTELRLDVHKAEKVFPPQISKAAKTEIEAATKRIHHALGCKEYSRSDFVVTKTGDVYFLEINTLPSLTKNSPFAASAFSVGASMEEVLKTLLQQASNAKK